MPAYLLTSRFSLCPLLVVLNFPSLALAPAANVARTRAENFQMSCRTALLLALLAQAAQALCWWDIRSRESQRVGYALQFALTIDDA